MNVGEVNADVYIARFSPDGPWLAVKSRTGTLRVFDSQAHQLVSEINMPEGQAWPVAFSHRSERLILFTRTPPRFHEWDLRTGRLSASWTGPEGAREYSLVISPVGDRALIVGRNSVVRDMTPARCRSWTCQSSR